ncbi:hypothetical protein IID22_00715 [Patescibacteria group bacterium]|nr:hypothetical protein [Patescibacteria group bacterium]
MKSKLLVPAAIALVAIGGGITIYNNISRRNSVPIDNNVEIGKEGGRSEAFPTNFPVYPGAELESSYDSKGEEVEATSVIWVAQGSLKEISDFYRKELTIRGWKVESVLEDKESVTFSFERGDSFGFIGVGKQDVESVIISVTIGARFESLSI